MIYFFAYMGDSAPGQTTYGSGIVEITGTDNVSSYEDGKDLFDAVMKAAAKNAGVPREKVTVTSLTRLDSPPGSR